MKTPTIEISVNESILRIEFFEDFDLGLAKNFEIDFSEFNEVGYQVSARRIGETILDQLLKWSPHLDKFSTLNDEKIDQLSPQGIAHKLIHMSIAEKTKIHLPSIENLLRKENNPSNETRKFLTDSWPVIKSQIESFTD